jgi:hypothetical protein
MPAKHSLRAHHRQARSPVTQPRPYGQAKSRCSIDPTRPDTPFLEKRDLPAQDQVLGDDRPARPENKDRELNHVGQHPQKESRQQDHEIMMPHAVLLARAVPASNISGPQVN